MLEANNQIKHMNFNFQVSFHSLVHPELYSCRRVRESTKEECLMCVSWRETSQWNLSRLLNLVIVDFVKASSYYKTFIKKFTREFSGLGISFWICRWDGCAVGVSDSVPESDTFQNSALAVGLSEPTWHLDQQSGVCSWDSFLFFKYLAHFQLSTRYSRNIRRYNCCPKNI